LEVLEYKNKGLIKLGKPKEDEKAASFRTPTLKVSLSLKIGCV
jgi:hypothetical protein